MNRFIFAMLAFLFCLAFPKKAFADGEQQQQQQQQQQKNDDTPQSSRGAAAEIARLRRENEELKRKQASGGGGGGGDGDDTVDKFRKQKAEDDRKAQEVREVERAVRFNLTCDEFIAANKALLPEEMEGIISRAKSEKYESDVKRSAAFRAAILKSYFSVQANVDSLTASQKATIENWKGLTQAERESRSADVYESIFEPAIEAAKKVRKAEEVGRARSGMASETAHGIALRDKIRNASRARYMREKT